eukprot:5012687-Lingulodinium_polyedra.AAC.1
MSKSTPHCKNGWLMCWFTFKCMYNRTARNFLSCAHAATTVMRVSVHAYRCPLRSRQYMVDGRAALSLTAQHAQGGGRCVVAPVAIWARNAFPPLAFSPVSFTRPPRRWGAGGLHGRDIARGDGGGHG